LQGTATYKGRLAEIVLLGLYTGARLDELCSLRAADLTPMKGRTSGFVVKIGQTGGKREASIRTIVVTHAVPVGILKGRRGAQKTTDAGALLFPDLIPGGPDDKLSWHVSKAFGRYRDDCKLPRGVDFHSLRRTFITRLENTQGMDVGKIARYVGHQIKGVTFGVSSGGSTEQTMRMVADAIRFPAKIERAAVGFLDRAKGAE
jgi:integrase